MRWKQKSIISDTYFAVNGLLIDIIFYLTLEVEGNGDIYIKLLFSIFHSFIHCKEEQTLWVNLKKGFSKYREQSEKFHY